MNRERYAIDAALDRLGQSVGEDLSRRVLLRRLTSGGLAVAITTGGLRVRPSQAQESTPATEESAPLASHHFTVGQLDCLVVDDGFYTVPAPFVAINAPPEELARTVDQIGVPVDAFPARINNLLVTSGSDMVLIDTGFGGLDPNTGRLLPTLAANGIAPEDVSVVLLTHLHADHWGGAVDANGSPTFPNARYLINQTEYDFWNAEPSLVELPLDDDLRTLFREGAKGTITSLGDKLEPIQPGTEIAAGVTPIAAPGHTPGHLAVEVSSEGQTLLHIVDAATHPVLHLEHTDWFLAPDNWPGQAILTRRQLFDRAATENLLVLTYHFDFPGLGHVAAAGEGWLWEPEA